MTEQEQLRSLLDRQVALVEARDLEGLVSQYHADAVVLRFDLVARGLEEIRRFFGDYLSLDPRIERVDAYAEAEDMLAYVASIRTRDATLQTYGTLLVTDGKIRRQFAGVMSRTPHEV